MKIKILRFILFIFLVISCKKKEVDGSSTGSFRSSINDMTSSLPTLQQIKFNEALYILKTFAVEGESDIERLKQLAQKLDGKKVSEIFELANKIAEKNNVDWSSTFPPSLGKMNIFQNVEIEESDPNDIKASSLEITVKPVEVDSLFGVNAYSVTPKLLDNEGNSVEFSNAVLDVTMEILNGGNRLLVFKNIMSSNNFRGFYFKISSLPKDKMVGNKIDIKVNVKTSEKIFSITKTGITINPNLLKSVLEGENNNTEDGEYKEMVDQYSESISSLGESPKETVRKFLNSLSSQNYRVAYDISENPDWGSYEDFSNPLSGFGLVKSLSIKKISIKSNTNQIVNVDATYDAVYKNGNKSFFDVSYRLRWTASGWKIVGYKVNSLEKIEEE